jgi:hypothetical protein
VLGSVGASYLILAHRLWWAYAVIFLAQVGVYIFMSTPDKARNGSSGDGRRP